jgi:isochorismate synthase
MTTAFDAYRGTAVLPGSTALLAGYRPGPATAFFAGPRATLLAQGVRRSVTDPAEAAEALRAESRAGAPGPVLVGAVPFQPGSAARLFIPDQIRRAGPLGEDPLLQLPTAPSRARSWRRRPVPAPDAYRVAVAEAVRRMAAEPALSKVVLARTLELTSAGGADLPAVLHRLARRDPHGYTFAVPAGPRSTLVGASPELLVSRRATAVLANPLAGSAARSPDLAEDVRRAAALLDSPKDLHEHAVVVNAVREALAPHCATLSAPQRPSLVRTAAMWHLSTTVTGTLADPGTSALDLALALHPTPAVCGAPTARARELIGELETFDRGLYAGLVGWGDADGDGEWVVTLRCAEAQGDLLRLYAGAGIVAGSRPDDELAETEAKFATLLHAVAPGGAA